MKKKGIVISMGCCIILSTQALAVGFKKDSPQNMVLLPEGYTTIDYKTLRRQRIRQLAEEEKETTRQEQQKESSNCSGCRYENSGTIEAIQFGQGVEQKIGLDVQ